MVDRVQLFLGTEDRLILYRPAYAEICWTWRCSRSRPHLPTWVTGRASAPLVP